MTPDINNSDIGACACAASRLRLLSLSMAGWVAEGRLVAATPVLVHVPQVSKQQLPEAGPDPAALRTVAKCGGAPVQAALRCRSVVDLSAGRCGVPLTLFRGLGSD